MSHSRKVSLAVTICVVVGAVAGVIISFLLPIFCFFVVPVLFGWVAGGGWTKGVLLASRYATALSIGAIGATTFIMTFTLGWDRHSQEWILYSFLGMMTIFWLSYAGMRWLHDSSGSVPNTTR